MKRAAVVAAVALAIVAEAPAVLAEAESARVVLLAIPEQDPTADDVREELAEQLSSVGVAVDVVEAEQAPAGTDDWKWEARAAASAQPGTLGLIGWTCGEEGCVLVVVDARSGALAEIPVAPDEQQEEGEGDRVFALAATSREVIVGSLLPELGRLAEEGQRPSPPPPTGERVPQAYSTEAGPEAGDSRPWLWIEGGYIGEHPYPQGQTLHGPWVGLALAAQRTVVPALSFGWLGLQRVSNEAGTVRSHRLPIALELRIAVPVGPATFSIAPMGRLDLVFATADPVGPRGASSQIEIEVHVGGRTAWNLPLPGGVEAVVGAGILGTLIGHEYAVDGRRAIPESTLRFGWWVGVAWSPLN